ncbi:haloacid dehalogenase-like hydrolase [Salinisphaera sp. G21_0]|uniref:haloacid dehalogenase-like hydrolase n=1 Tax=Salinisphaera sp. G21_0 TaxID=2821094 RepID=UPI001ADB5799|nr:haloacid dehalogenase-like hydrolase [Salinisphaera sp. G21_0]
MQNRKIAVFDFDETLISVNSFPLWCKWLLTKSIREFKLTLVFKLFFLFSERKLLKTITHTSFKEQLCALKYPSSWDFDFSDYLNDKQWNEEIVNELLEHKKNSNYVLVTSAAPTKYLLPIIKSRLSTQVDKIIGSSIDNHVYLDNYKENKVASLYQENIKNIDFLYTDSLDDLPLMKIADEVNFILDKSAKLPVIKDALHQHHINNVNFIKVNN